MTPTDDGHEESSTDVRTPSAKRVQRSLQLSEAHEPQSTRHTIEELLHLVHLRLTAAWSASHRDALPIIAQDIVAHVSRYALDGIEHAAPFRL